MRSIDTRANREKILRKLVAEKKQKRRVIEEMRKELSCEHRSLIEMMVGQVIAAIKEGTRPGRYKK